jgi:hypothetical protein
MLESIVELLVGLFLIGLTLLVGACIVGSIVAARSKDDIANGVLGTRNMGGVAKEVFPLRDAIAHS